MFQIGITERGDAALDDSWVDWVYKKDKPAILITKNAPLLQEKHPDIFFKNVIIHVTCTGLGGTIFEPNVPKPSVIWKWIREKPASIQRKLVLRIDPICTPLFNIKNDKFDGEVYAQTLSELFGTAKNFQLRCRISFLDYYPHVRERFKAAGIDLDEFYGNFEYNGIHLPLQLREATLKLINPIFATKDLEICGEPGLACTGCVSKKDLDIFGLDMTSTTVEANQRLACKCLGFKKELLTNKSQCPHKCMYCYWK